MSVAPPHICAYGLQVFSEQQEQAIGQLQLCHRIADHRLKKHAEMHQHAAMHQHAEMQSTACSYGICILVNRPSLQAPPPTQILASLWPSLATAGES